MNIERIERRSSPEVVVPCSTVLVLAVALKPLQQSLDILKLNLRSETLTEPLA